VANREQRGNREKRKLKTKQPKAPASQALPSLRSQTGSDGKKAGGKKLR
jgi:hypothetical protein